MLNQHFKAAQLSIIPGCVPSSLRTWVSFDYRDVRSMCVTSEDDITLSWESVVDIDEHKENLVSLHPSLFLFTHCKNPPHTVALSVYHKGAS